MAAGAKNSCSFQSLVYSRDNQCIWHPLFHIARLSRDSRSRSYSSMVSVYKLTSLMRFVLFSGPRMFFVHNVGRRDQVGEFLRRTGDLRSVGRFSKWMVSIRWCIRFTHSGFRSWEKPLQDTRNWMDARPTSDRSRRRRYAQGVLPLGEQYLQLEQQHQSSSVSRKILCVRIREASSLSSAILQLSGPVTWPRWAELRIGENLVNRETTDAPRHGSRREE